MAFKKKNVLALQNSDFSQAPKFDTLKCLKVILIVDLINLMFIAVLGYEQNHCRHADTQSHTSEYSGFKEENAFMGKDKVPYGM